MLKRNIYNDVEELLLRAQGIEQERGGTASSHDDIINNILRACFDEKILNIAKASGRPVQEIIKEIINSLESIEINTIVTHHAPLPNGKKFVIRKMSKTRFP